METEDRRVRKTKSSIKQAMISLLNEKDIEKITIQDISNKADINRGTFYLHFEDKYILLDEMEDECISELKMLTQFDKILGDSAEETAQLFIENVLTNIFNHIQDNIDFYSTILKIDRTSRLEEKISSLIKNNMLNYMSVEKEIDGIPEMYFYSYVSDATISFIKYWVQDEHRIPVDELTHHLFKIVYYGPLRIITEHRHQINQ